MMNREEIRQQELKNDGQSVYLHYCSAIGLYVAYGLSAYYADMGTTPELNYSVAMQMPVALLDRRCVFDLKHVMTQVSHTADDEYCFRSRAPIGDDGYDRWAYRIIKRLTIL